MNKIFTLTVNPVVDKHTTLRGFRPDIKMRCKAPIYYAGGGGINVSRAIHNLGGYSTAIYLAGGRNGKHLQHLMSEIGIAQEVITIDGPTRDNLTVSDKVTGLEYRFGMPGPFVKQAEWQAILDRVDTCVQEGDYLVASGKLPLGIPDDFYTNVANIVCKKKARMVLDTKGAALKEAVKADLFLCKPNLSELSDLCGVSSISSLDMEPLVQKFLQHHKCRVLVVSLGAMGAVLASRDSVVHIPAPVVQHKNLIGAGDSMVAGMLLALQGDRSYFEMAQYGVACGTAATLRKGTQLCGKKDVEQLHRWMQSSTLSIDREKLKN